MIDFAGVGQLLLGVAAVAGVVVNALSNHKRKLHDVKVVGKLDEVQEATNGLSEKLQAMSYREGHKAAEDEAAALRKDSPT